TFLKKASAEQVRILTALFSGSATLSDLVVSHPQWLEMVLKRESVEHPRHKQGLERELQTSLRPLLKTGDYSGALGSVRQFKQREMLRIAARDLARLADASEVTLEISHVADICLTAVYEVCWAQLIERLGEPYHQDADGDWRRTEFVLFGMGKLGGQELN